MTTPASNCHWSTASTVPWLTLSSRWDGAGNGMVGTDPNAAQRSGAINLAGLTFMVVRGGVFNNVPVGHPFYTEIGKLSARGVSRGCGGGNYCPAAH